MSALDIGLVCQNVVRRDGQGRVMLELARALTRRGHSVTVYAHRLDDEVSRSVSFRRVPRPPGPQLVDDLVFLVLATAAVRRRRHDVVCVLGPTALPKAPFVYNAQFSHPGWRRTWTRATRPALYHRVHARIVGALETLVARRAERIVSSTAALSADVLSGAGDKTVVVPNGVDLSEFTVPSPGERAAARERFGFAPDDVVVGFFGDWATPRKGLDPLLRALASSARTEKLLLASDGDRAALRGRLAGLGLEERVVVAGFEAPRNVLAASDVVCVPSLYEPFSLVALEAAASEVPVVLAASAGAAPLLDGAAVTIADPRDPDQIREALARLHGADERRRRASVARRLAEELSWDRVFVRAVETIERVVPRSRPKAVYVADTTANVRMLEGLSRSFDVTLLARASLGPHVATRWPPAPDARVDRVLLRGGRVGFALRAAWWMVRRRRRFDVTIALDSLLAASAANVAHLAGGPRVVLQVGRPTLDYIRVQRGLRPAWRYVPRIAVARCLVALNERTAAGIGTVSEYVARQCARRNGNVRAIAWYGIDTDVFAARWTRSEARALLGLPEDGPIALYRSRLAPEKDPETFLLAVDRLRREGLHLHAVYMGGEWEEMQRVAERLGVEVIARDCEGTDEIPVWYVAADVCVQTSKEEGLGLSPLESLACGTPVVCTDVGGLAEVTDGGRFGELVPQGDVEATAAAIERSIGEREASTARAAEARAWIAERYSAERALGAWAELIGGAARGARPPRWRVLFVDHETRLSGGQRDLVDLVRALDPARVEVHAALPGEGELADALRACGATVHVVPMAQALRRASRWDLARRPDRTLRYAASAVRAAWALTAVARRLRPDVVHSNSLKAHVLASPAAKLARARNVWHVRDILDGWLREAWRVLAGVLADRVVCLSEVAAEPFRRGRAARKVRVVYNGIAPRPVSPREVETWRTNLGATDGEPVIGIVGQLARWKGQDTFVEAAALVAEARPDARFAIVGECLFPENESAYVAALREKADTLGLDGRLRFLGSVDPIEPVMAALDVAVHASRLPEPFGRVVVEAMAQGTPVVASSLGAGPELVPPEAGRLVEPDDPGALAAAIGELLTGDGRARAEAAARNAAAAFDISRTGAGVLSVYEELLA